MVLVAVDVEYDPLVSVRYSFFRSRIAPAVDLPSRAPARWGGFEEMSGVLCARSGETNAIVCPRSSRTQEGRLMAAFGRCNTAVDRLHLGMTTTWRKGSSPSLAVVTRLSSRRQMCTILRS